MTVSWIRRLIGWWLSPSALICPNISNNALMILSRSATLANAEVKNSTSRETRRYNSEKALKIDRLR